MTVALAHPVGFVEFDGVWLDDRRRCTWALCDLSFVAEPGRMIAIVSRPDEGGADAVLDLLAGARRANRGRVGVDGVDLRDLDRPTHLATLTAEHCLDVGERRLTLAGRTTFVARPTPATLRASSLVIVLDAGFEVCRGSHADLLATSEGYRRLVGHPEHAEHASV